jgi:predicted nicotinamide N-methyase
VEELVSQTIDLPSGELTLLQPAESAELPDDREVDWAPLVPYWSVLWRSGVALAREVDELDLTGKRVIELGCGLGAPSLAAGRAGASVLAIDAEPQAIELLGRNATLNGIELEAQPLDWSLTDELAARGPFDLALAADVLYERQAVAPLLALLPRLAPSALIADPGRPASGPFFERVWERWRVEARRRGPVTVNEIRMASSAR